MPNMVHNIGFIILGQNLVKNLLIILIKRLIKENYKYYLQKT